MRFFKIYLSICVVSAFLKEQEVDQIEAVPLTKSRKEDRSDVDESEEDVSDSDMNQLVKENEKFIDASEKEDSIDDLADYESTSTTSQPNILKNQSPENHQKTVTELNKLFESNGPRVETSYEKPAELKSPLKTTTMAPSDKDFEEVFDKNKEGISDEEEDFNKIFESYQAKDEAEETKKNFQHARAVFENIENLEHRQGVGIPVDESKTKSKQSRSNIQGLIKRLQQQDKQEKQPTQKHRPSNTLGSPVKPVEPPKPMSSKVSVQKLAREFEEIQKQEKQENQMHRRRPNSSKSPVNPAKSKPAESATQQLIQQFENQHHQVKKSRNATPRDHGSLRQGQYQG